MYIAAEEHDKNTNTLEIKGEEIILAVHSDQLLRDLCELKSILEPLLGGERHMYVLELKGNYTIFMKVFQRSYVKQRKT